MYNANSFTHIAEMSAHKFKFKLFRTFWVFSNSHNVWEMYSSNKFNGTQIRHRTWYGRAETLARLSHYTTFTLAIFSVCVSTLYHLPIRAWWKSRRMRKIDTRWSTINSTTQAIQAQNLNQAHGVYRLYRALSFDTVLWACIACAIEFIVNHDKFIVYFYRKMATQFTIRKSTYFFWFLFIQLNYEPFVCCIFSYTLVVL